MDTYHYYTDQPMEDFKADVRQLLERTQSLNFSVNLTGEFIAADEFKMTPKWSFITTRGFEPDPSYLHGYIFQDEWKRTRVTFTIRPNSVFPLFSIAFPLFFLMLLVNNTPDDAKTRIAIVVMIVVLPLFLWAVGHYAKEGIRNRFIQTFGLTPVE